MTMINGREWPSHFTYDEIQKQLDWERETSARGNKAPWPGATLHIPTIDGRPCKSMAYWTGGNPLENWDTCPYDGKGVHQRFV